MREKRGIGRKWSEKETEENSLHRKMLNVKTGWERWRKTGYVHRTHFKNKQTVYNYEISYPPHSLYRSTSNILKIVIVQPKNCLEISTTTPANSSGPSTLITALHPILSFLPHFSSAYSLSLVPFKRDRSNLGSHSNSMYSCLWNAFESLSFFSYAKWKEFFPHDL